METTYRVVIKGAKEGVSVEQAIRQLAALFKATEDQIRPLFAAPGSVVKKGVDIKTATQYLSAIEQAGAQAIVEPEMTPDLQIDLPQQAMAPGNAAATDVIPEKIRKNLANCQSHVKTTCLECGYAGLIGITRTDERYRYLVVAAMVLYFAWMIIVVAWGSQWGQYISWWWTIPCFVLGAFAKQRTNILLCPNCEKELVQK